MAGEIDWAALASRLGARGDGPTLARAALAEILGEPALEAAVERCLSHEPGHEIARAVLALVRPAAALRHAFRVFRQGGPIERRRRAVELLAAIGDAAAAGWIGEFLADPDEAIQADGAALLDHLLWNFLVEPDEVEMELRRIREHSSPAVRERASKIRSYLAARDYE